MAYETTQKEDLGTRNADLLEEMRLDAKVPTHKEPST